MSRRNCPRCDLVYSGPVPGNGMALCTGCGHRFLLTASSDEYLPEPSGVNEAIKPLTSRRHGPTGPGATTVPAPLAHVSTDLASSSLPFDQLEAEAARKPPQRPVSELAFRPSSEAGQGSRIHCPVCGHSFAGDPLDEEHSCPQCATRFSRTTGRLAAGGGVSGDRLIGRVLRGCMIDRKLGEGGMGAVYHARQLSLDRSVAIKVLPPELARNRNFIQRFEREAKSLARINHANILQIYDFGEEQQLGVYFMVIEFVDGWDLGEILRRQPTLSQVETLDIIRQSLLGLEQAADKGVIHRDIKPDNLMIATSGLCKVSDFGLAKGHRSESEVTSVGVRVGTPAFMSPEQCDGVEVDSRSDVYNLGCTAFLMLTGRLPFDGETPFSIMLKHKVDPIPSLRAIDPAIDPRVDELIRRMLAKRPDERCHDLRELVDATESTLVALTGTQSVLRKTNGPIRALANRTSGSGKRPAADTDLQVDLPPQAMDPGSSPSRPPVRAAGNPPSAEGRRPSGRQRPVAPPAPEIPSWLRPVDPPATGEATPGTQPGTQTGTQTGPQPAKPASPAKASQRAQAIGARSQPATTVGRITASVPALQAQPPQRTPSSTNLDRARDRGLKAEVAAISAGAERMATSGNWDKAASEWRRASQLARDHEESRRLQSLAEDAARKARSRRRLRITGILAGATALVLVNLFIWPPLLHNVLAERERARIDAIADPAQRAHAMRGFVAANQGGWAWYRLIFRRGYEVPATAATRPQSSPDRPVRPDRADRGQRPAAADPERLAADPAVSWQAVAEAARTAAQQGDQRGKEWLFEAERRINEATALRTRLDAARSEGRHGEALDLAARLRTDHPRAGALLDQLPLPGRLRVFDADTRSPIAGFTVTVDGVPIVGDDGRFCRQARAETTLDVAARGYLPGRLSVTPVAEFTERQVDAFLDPAPAWRTPGASATSRPAWLRLVPVGQQHALLLLPDLAVRIAAADGAARPMAVPGTQVASWWQPTPAGCVYATRDGELREVRPQADQPALWRRLPTAPVALLDSDSVLRVGTRLVATVEDQPAGRSLVVREGPRELWRRGGFDGQHEPWLRRVDDRIIVIDDNNVHVFDETGEMQPRYPLKGRRSGALFELPGNRVLVPTEVGVDVVQLAGSGARPVDVPWLATAGQAVVAGAGETVLIARADRQVELVEWKGEPRLRWNKRISGRPAWAAVGQGVAAVVDEAGSLTAWRIVDGQTLRHANLGLPPACAPLLLPGMLLSADISGAVSAWRMP